MRGKKSTNFRDKTRSLIFHKILGHATGSRDPTIVSTARFPRKYRDDDRKCVFDEKAKLHSRDAGR